MSRPLRAKRRNLCGLLLSVTAVFVLHGRTACGQADAAVANTQDVVTARSGVVVSVSAPASGAGLQILKQGGNAVDAAVATAFALAVTYPPAGNIGGGGFMLIHPGPGAEAVCIEYRETAPQASRVDMYSTDDPRTGHRVVGVPGTVRGMALAHAKFGKLPWKQVVMPAVRLAQDGFTLPAELANSLNSLIDTAEDIAEFRRVYGPPQPSRRWQAGERLVLSDLARTLRMIADDGPEAFYAGPIARQIVAEMKRGDGLISLDDLAAYRAKVRRPIRGTYRGYVVWGPPPPSSGGICLVEMLNILENFDLRAMGRWSPETLHLMIEAMRRAYCDRARYLGDGDFVPIPVRLTQKPYARRLAQEIDRGHATPSEQLAPEIPLAGEGASTTHFSVIDAGGMAVSNTYTLEASYGSRVVVRGAGFLLNNEMGDFNWRPGHTDRRGAIGTPPNIIAPGKRMLSSQTPVIVTKNGRVRLITGSPGGRTIINTALCVVLNVLEFDMDLRTALDAPRLHHQWFPDQVRIEDRQSDSLDDALGPLRELGHTITRAGRQGDAHSILVDAQQHIYYGAADSRRHGWAAGY